MLVRRDLLPEHNDYLRNNIVCDELESTRKSNDHTKTLINLLVHKKISKVRFMSTLFTN